MTIRAPAPSVGHDPTRPAPPVKRLFISVGVFVGSAIGWKAGEAIGMRTAYMFSVVGSGLGAYAGIRVARELE